MTDKVRNRERPEKINGKELPCTIAERRTSVAETFQVAGLSRLRCVTHPLTLDAVVTTHVLDTIAPFAKNLGLTLVSAEIEAK